MSIDLDMTVCSSPIEDTCADNEENDLDSQHGQQRDSIDDLLVGVMYANVDDVCLPDLCLEKIIIYSMNADLSCRWRLRSVCKFFKQVVDKLEKHRLYLNQLVCQKLSLEYDALFSGMLCISVNSLQRAAGKGSSAVMELRAKFQNTRWHTAWLVLANEGFGWFSIENIFWK
jgi:hypothetical protein